LIGIFTTKVSTNETTHVYVGAYVCVYACAHVHVCARTHAFVSSDSLTHHSLTLTHSLTYPLTHSLTHSLTHCSPAGLEP
jgi:hypothetical protein